MPTSTPTGNLEETVRSCLPVFLTLARQLRETVSAARAAVQGACFHFEQIGTNALAVASAEGGPGEKGQRLLHDVAGAVMALQFEDRMSQRVDQVAQALEQLHGALGAPFTEGAPLPLISWADLFPSEGADGESRPPDRGGEIDLF